MYTPVAAESFNISSVTVDRMFEIVDMIKPIYYRADPLILRWLKYHPDLLVKSQRSSILYPTSLLLILISSKCGLVGQ